MDLTRGRNGRPHAIRLTSSGLLGLLEVIQSRGIKFRGTPLDIVFTGILADGVISGSADFGGMGEGEWTAKRSSD